MTDPTRRTILGAGLLAGAGVLSACGGPPTSECLQGEHQLEGGPVYVFPFIAPERPRLKRQVSPQSLTVSPDGKRVAAYEPWDRRLLEESETAVTTVWDTVTGEILARLNDRMTDAIAWNPHDDLLATAASSVVRISRSDGEVLWTLSGHRVNTRWRTFDIKDLAFHPDGHQLASLSTDGTVRLWSLDGGTCTPSPVLRVRSGRPSSLAYTEDGSRIAVAVDGAGAQLGDPSSGERAEPFDDCGREAVGIALDGQGRFVLGIGEEGRLQVAGQDGTCSPGTSTRITVPEFIATAPDGRVAVSGGKSRGLELWDADLTESSYIDLPEFIPDIGAPGELGRTAWGPDGTLYAVARWWGVIAWDGQGWRPFELP